MLRGLLPGSFGARCTDADGGIAPQAPEAAQATTLKNPRPAQISPASGGTVHPLDLDVCTICVAKLVPIPGVTHVALVGQV